MMLLRLLNLQGAVGGVVAIALAVLLAVQSGETRHWKKESARFEQLYGQQQSALSQTVASYRAAAAQAHASDQANAERVAAEQHAINERTSNDYEARLAAARTLAQRLRRAAAGAAAHPGSSGGAAVSGVHTGSPASS